MKPFVNVNIIDAMLRSPSLARGFIVLARYIKKMFS